MSGEQVRKHEMRVREGTGLRADRQWVDWVAEHGVDGGMQLGILLSPTEITQLVARDARSQAAFAAFSEAVLDSDAGVWIDQPAGGVARLQLAYPDASERAIAEQIVAEHGGKVSLVEHSTYELKQVKAMVEQERERHPGFAEKAGHPAIAVKGNTVELLLRSDIDPQLIPPSLQTAVTAGTLVLGYADEVKARAL